MVSFKDSNSAKKSGRDKIVYYGGLVLLFVIYYFAYKHTLRAARTDDIVFMAGMEIPLSAFTGVFSSLANICIFLLVVFYGKLGFITSLALIFYQVSGLILAMANAHSLMSIPGMFSALFTVIAIVMMYMTNNSVQEYRIKEIDHLKEQQQLSQKLFEQTATALVNAIDAKDTYSHGHSIRVAEYSEKIARLMGKSDDECYRIYYAALVHDVGKIGIDDSIINKEGPLERWEYDIIKTHPVIGNQILSSINEYPYLSIGAHYHHERYDGKGYPDGLKGEDIPEIARIISVADAYDAMSSNRSYREAIPQQIIREEIVKGAGTQFDPEMAKIMQHLIDKDAEYRMKERNAVRELAGRDELRCDEFKSSVSDGIIITSQMTSIHLVYMPDRTTGKNRSKASLILFDSLDGRYHDDERTVRDLAYSEYCEIGFDGDVTLSEARKSQTETKKQDAPAEFIQDPDSVVYDIEAVKYKDHVLVRIDNGTECTEVIIALPDSSRYVYIGLTGENCFITDVDIEKADVSVSADYIPRIAEEISYLSGPEGDIPSIQVDGHMTAVSLGVAVKDGMQISFHTMSLPTARLIWHCPFVILFSSKDGKVGGPDYVEYAALRLDGECIDDGIKSANKMTVNKTEDFADWDTWKRANKEGFDCTVKFVREGNMIITASENFGIAIRNITTITEEAGEVYAVLSGDQVALTNIRTIRE